MPSPSSVREDSDLRLCVVGAAPDTGNRGVSALASSILSGIARRAPGASVTFLDHGAGVREGFGPLTPSPEDGGQELRGQRVGCVNTRRVYRRESLVRARVAAAVGLSNPAINAIREADAVLDISGGDSFTDLYGPRRFEAIARPKLLTLSLGKPLILLPQTFGPFRERGSRRVATNILEQATQVWARDTQSYEVMKHLLGSNFDSRRHRLGVDLAFALKPRKPEAWTDPWGGRAVIGVNVSGLLYNAPADTLRDRFGFAADYRAVIHDLVTRLARESTSKIVLLSHVVPPSSHEESDAVACQRVLDSLPAGVGDRVSLSDPTLDEGEIKWLISRLDWLCSTRMHAAIAGLSTGIPTAAIAYSDKTRGVFATCGQAKSVVDPRYLSTEDVVSRLIGHWKSRAHSRRMLDFGMPSVVRSAELCLSDALLGLGQTARPLALERAA